MGRVEDQWERYGLAGKYVGLGIGRWGWVELKVGGVWISRGICRWGIGR